MNHAANGYYTPSGYSIHIDLNSDENLSPHTQTVVHEYIHFLQDIILPYCIKSTLININHFQFVCKDATDKKEICFPFQSWDEERKITHAQSGLSWGCNLFLSDIKIVNILCEATFVEKYNYNIYSYTLILDNGQDYIIGARDFLEYIAHTIESKFWNTYHDDLPYKSVDLLFSYYNFECITTEIKLLLVEFCLYNDNPMHFFQNILINDGIIKHISENALDYNTSVKVLLGLSWRPKSTGMSNDEITAISKATKRKQEYYDKLCLLYCHRQYNSIQRWIKKVVTYTKDKFINKFIFSELYVLPNDLSIGFLEQIINDLGVPLLIFKNNVVRFGLSDDYKKDQFIQLYILKKFINSLYDSNGQCPIFDICQANYDYDRDLCKLRSNKQEEVCPYILFLKSYCLDNLEFKYR